MKINIKATNLGLTLSLSEYIKQKIGSLEKFLKNMDPEVIEFYVEVGRITRHHRQGDVYRAEINLSLPGRLLRAEAEEWDIRVAIDTAKDEMQREIKKYKEKQKAKYKRGAEKLKRILRFWKAS